MKMNKKRTTTSYIIHLVVCELSSISALIKSTCNLTVKRLEIDNKTYRQKVGRYVKKQNSMRQLIIMIMIFTALNKVINAQEIVADRPDQTESSTTVPSNSFQMEIGFGNGNYTNESLSLLPTALFRYGLSKSIEIRFVEQLGVYNKKATSKTESGLSDIELGLKIQVLKKQDINTEIAFISHLIVPTGSSEFTNASYGTINKLAISHGLNNFLVLGYNLGYNYFGTGNGDLTYSLVIGIGLSNRMGMYVESFGEYSDFTEMTSNFDSGFTYLLKDNLQLDFSVGLGLTQEMNYYSLGFSWNINCNANKNK